MMVVAPACVLVGVLLPDWFMWMSPAVEWLFAFMTFQSSMGATSRQMLGVLRRPRLLVCALVVELVCMPLIARGVGQLLLSGEHDVMLGMVLEYCVPMGVNGLMWTEIFMGDKAFALAVVIISTLLVPVTLPLSMQLLMGTSVQVDVLGMMRDLLVMVALPSVLGIACNDLSHGRANARVAPWLAPAGKLAMVLVLVVNSAHIAEPMRHLTPTLVAVAVAMFFVSSFGYVAGYAVARLLHRDVSEALTCGLTTGARNIASGAVIAEMYFADVTLFPVMMGTLFQHLIAATYGTLVRRLEARSAARPPTRRG